ncbi:MAG: FHA domain-containing protein [Pseudomonadota bacterium]
MSEFVRICPKCRHQNPEYENACTECGHFVGMEAAVPKPASPKPARPKPEAAKKAPRRQRKQVQSKLAETTEKDPPAFYLDIAGTDKVYTIQDGWVLGQAHGTNTAHIQIPEDITGSGYIHRQHCRFEHRDKQWFITPIDQKLFERDFTNPTFVNQYAVAPNTRHPIKNGDTLTLAGVSFTVKMI